MVGATTEVTEFIRVARDDSPGDNGVGRKDEGVTEIHIRVVSGR